MDPRGQAHPNTMDPPRLAHSAVMKFYTHHPVVATSYLQQRSPGNMAATDGELKLLLYLN